MAARKRVRGARPAAGAAAGREGTTAAAKLQRQQRKIELVFGKDAADRIAEATGVKVVLDRLAQREAEASVALDKDPDARTYSLEHCDLCNRLGTVDVEIVVFKDANDRTWWRCAPSLGCLDAAAVDAALAAMADGTYFPELRGRAPTSTPPADLGGVRSETRAEYMDRVSKMDPLQRLALVGTTVPDFTVADSDEPSLMEERDFEPLRNYAPPPSVRMGKPGLYLDVDLNAAPPLKVSLDPDRSWRNDSDPISDIQAGIRAQYEAWARRAPAQTREQAEAMVAKLEEVMLGAALLGMPCLQPGRNGHHETYTDGKVDHCRACGASAPTVVPFGPGGGALARGSCSGPPALGANFGEGVAETSIVDVVGPLRVQLANAQQTARNVAERFRMLGVPLVDRELGELLTLTVGAYPPGPVIRGLGVDPGYANLGFVAVDFGPSWLRVVHREKLITDTSDDDDVRLDRIAQKIDSLVYQLAPHFVAYENVAAVHAGIAMMAKAGKAGARGDNAGARRQLEVSGMIRSSTLRYGCTGYTVTPSSARRGVLGKGNTKGATKQTVRDAVERILGVRGLSLELSDAAAIVLAGYGKHRAATLKGRRRRR